MSVEHVECKPLDRQCNNRYNAMATDTERLLEPSALPVKGNPSSSSYYVPFPSGFLTRVLSEPRRLYTQRRGLGVFLVVLILCLLLYVSTVEFTSYGYRQSQYFTSSGVYNNATSKTILISSMDIKFNKSVIKRGRTHQRVKDKHKFRYRESQMSRTPCHAFHLAGLTYEGSIDMLEEWHFDDEDDEGALVSIFEGNKEEDGRVMPPGGDDPSLMNGTWHGSVDMKPLSFLDGYKNPCWIEKLPSNEPYHHNIYLKLYKHLKKYVKTLSQHWTRRIQRGRGWRLRCLPYFYVIGQPKCGTTDLYYRLTEHPDITPGSMKEPHWWSRKRLGITSYQNLSVPFRDYVDLFDGAAECIRSHRKSKHYHHIVTGEASASTLWDNDEWAWYPENRGLAAPTYVIPHYLKRVQPNAKFIVILRNPTDRLYSDYLYFRLIDKSAEDFHQNVVLALDLMRQCMEKRSVRGCIYDYNLNRHMIKVRLRIGMYYPYLRDWFEIFPREQLHILRLEDYASNRTEIMRKSFEFLEVDPPPPEYYQQLDETPQANKRSETNEDVGPMWNETRELLDEFYGPFNTQLAAMLDNDDYLWKS